MKSLIPATMTIKVRLMLVFSQVYAILDWNRRPTFAQAICRFGAPRAVSSYGNFNAASDAI